MIYIDENYKVYIDSDLLGYQGETNARTIKVEQPTVYGADTYRLRLQYSDGSIYDVPIVDSELVVTASLLREGGEVNAQWLATKSNGNKYDLVAKSQIFELKIEPSISDDVAPVPPYEIAKEISDKVLSAVEDVQGAVDKLKDIDLGNIAQKSDLDDLAKEVGDNYRELSTEISRTRSDLNGSVNGLNQRVNTKANQSDVDELTDLIGTLNTQLENRLGGVADE